jgi:large subunit ribosomal protein L25
MAVQVLKMQPRTANGSKQVRRLRQQGLVPAVVYGHDGQSIAVQIDLADMGRELRAHRRVFEAEIEGKKEGVWLQEVQFDVLTDLPLHADFKRVHLDKPIQAEIELIFTGHPKGLIRGGKFRAENKKVPLSCRADAVPYEIEVGIGDLDLDQQILAKDIVLPEGAVLDCPEDMLIAELRL